MPPPTCALQLLFFEDDPRPPATKKRRIDDDEQSRRPPIAEPKQTKKKRPVLRDVTNHDREDDDDDDDDDYRGEEVAQGEEGAGAVVVREEAEEEVSCAEEDDEEEEEEAKEEAEEEDPFSSRYRGSLEVEARRQLVEDEMYRGMVTKSRRGAPFVVKAKREKRCLVATRAEEDFPPPYVYLGHGTYGAVFEIGGRAVKIERPVAALPWELLASSLYRQRRRQTPRRPMLGRRRGVNCIGDVVEPTRLWLWRDAAALAMPAYCASLADVLRLRRLPETAALYLAVAVLEPVAKIHACDLLHMDIKPDNFLLRFTDDDNDSDSCDDDEERNGVVGDAWDDVLRRSRGFAFPAVALADFGRAIDLRRHPQSIAFRSNRAHIDAYLWPPAKRAALPWTFHVDRYALGVVLHLIALGRFPGTSSSSYGTQKSKKPIHPKLPRGWDSSFWDTAFSNLLDDSTAGEPSSSASTSSLTTTVTIPTTTPRIEDTCCSLDDLVHSARHALAKAVRRGDLQRGLAGLDEYFRDLRRHLRQDASSSR